MEHLWSPWRLAYITGANPTTGCVFCHAAADPQADSLVVFRGATCFVILNLFPYAETEPAGGDAKNRLVDRTIRLDKGDYVVHYSSDDSHSYDDWNAAAPSDGAHWGVTLLTTTASVDRGAVSDYTEKADPSILAQMVRVRDDERPRKTFKLDRESQVRIYAIGEGSGRNLADYGWIEDARGKTVWEMTYRSTEPAGGAAKNRRFDGIVTLPAGEYTLRFETDDSHSFGSWNANPPDDPDMWGITVYRVK